MGRNTLSVIVGVVLSFFANAEAGALLYRLSDRLPSDSFRTGPVTLAIRSSRLLLEPALRRWLNRDRYC